MTSSYSDVPAAWEKIDPVTRTLNGWKLKRLDGCLVWNWPGWELVLQCTRDVERVAVVGCAGEHLIRTRLCLRHIGMIHQGQVMCGKCRLREAEHALQLLALLPEGEDGSE